MNKSNYFLILSIVLLFSVKIVAQTAPIWIPMKLAVTGNNTINGVQGSYTLDKCVRQDVIIMKFTNTNPYPVTVEWFDAIFTTDLKWVKEEKIENKKTLTIPANTEIIGKCDVIENKNCVIVLNKFLPKIENFKQYTALYLTVSNK